MPLDTNSKEIINDISSSFRAYIQHLWKDFELGLGKPRVGIERLGFCKDKDTSQFIVSIPYCGKHIKWEIIFDQSAPWFAPDFRFDDETFLCNVDSDFLETKAPSLHNWNSKDPEALTKAIVELRNLYKTYQVKLLSEDENSRAYFEYTALLGDAVISEDDIEVLTGSSHSVQFLIRLKVDTSRLPELFNENTDKNPGSDSALLLVRYPNANSAELLLSPTLNKVLGEVTLPVIHQSGVLMDYVPMVTNLINKKVQAVLENERLKREFLSHLVVKYEGAILEHNADGAAFLFEINGFHWILQIEISKLFPVKNPVITLRSVYHCFKGKPRTKVLAGCPYNNFEQYINEEGEIFKNECKGIQQTNNELINLDC